MNDYGSTFNRSKTKYNRAATRKPLILHGGLAALFRSMALGLCLSSWMASHCAAQNPTAGNPAPKATQPASDDPQPTTIRELKRHADAAIDQAKYESAFETAKRICNLKPESIEYQLFLGEVSFAAGKMDDCIAAYDRVANSRPAIAPHLWQRGLALYYANRFSDGVRQFETHQTVNSQDVENAVWHLICAARISDVEEARKKLIPISGDTRIPMSQIYEMFAGRMTPEDVMKIASDSPSAGDKNGRALQLYYAHLYIGLYHEMFERPILARNALNRAAKISPLKNSNFMGQVARVHLKLLDTASKQPKPKKRTPASGATERMPSKRK